MDTLMTDVTFHNDAFEYDPTLYTTAESGPTRTGDPEPVAPGYYRVQVVSGGPKKNRTTGKLITTKDPKTGADCPLFQIHRIEVLEPEDQAGLSYGIWQDVFTSSQPLRERSTNEVIPGKYVVDAFRILTAIDRSLLQPSYEENVRELARQLTEAKPTLVVRVAYEGFDKTHHAQCVANGMDDKLARKSAKLTSPMFKNADGTYRTETAGPSGEMVQAKLVIKEFVPEGTDVTLGPLKARRAR